MTAKLSKSVERAWARLVRSHRELMGAVEMDLKAADFPPLAWYDVLLELGRAKDEGATPRELERECLVEQYNLSRLLDRMEGQGLVRRLPYPGDKRRRLVEITDKGRALQKRMWPVYAASIQRLVGEKLSDEDAERLTAILDRLIAPDDGSTCSGERA